jgi:hypothetical protein
VFRLHANKAKKNTFFRFKARTKIPTFSLIFALSEYERRTLLQTFKNIFFEKKFLVFLVVWKYAKMHQNTSLTTPGGKKYLF